MELSPEHKQRIIEEEKQRLVEERYGENVRKQRSHRLTVRPRPIITVPILRRFVLVFCSKTSELQ
jgi:hypothetical protein